MNLASPKILAICPYRHLAVLLQTELGRHNLEVEACASVSEGISRAQRGGFSAVLVDDRPSQKKSIDCLGTLHRSVQPTTALLWMCANVTRNAALDALRAGAHGIVVRPTALPDLLGALLKALDRVRNDVARRVEPGVAIPAQPGSEADVWKILDRADSLRASPHVVEQVLTLTGSDEASAHDLARAVESDQNTTAVVLKRSNSALYAAGAKISKVKDAITRLGFRNVRSLVLTLRVIQNFKSDQRTLGFDPGEYWKFCSARAIVARTLVRASGGEGDDQVYLAALLHDIGKIILDEYLPDRFARAVTIARDQGLPLVESERHVLGSDHAAVGKRVLERWNFPPDLCEIAGLATLDDLGQASFAVRGAVARIAIAESVCRALGWGDAVDRHVEPLSPDHFAQSGITGPLPDSFFPEVVAEVNEMWSCLGSGVDRAQVPGKNADGSAILYEEVEAPVSPIELALSGAGIRVERVRQLADLAGAKGSGVAVVSMGGIDGLRRLHQACPEIGQRPVVILAPKDSFPADDSVKARVGIPSGKCSYVGLPVDVPQLLTRLIEL